MTTVTINFKSKGKEYTRVFLWRGPEATFEHIKRIYKKLGVKKATCQSFKLSTWNFWAGYAV